MLVLPGLAGSLEALRWRRYGTVGAGSLAVLSSLVMRRTPLHQVHVDAGAKMVDFAGWHLPIQFGGVAAEHLAVRKSAGLFDVSHMGELRVSGENATDFLRYAALNDVGKLQPGRGHYSMLPNDSGGLIDDLYIYREGDSEYLIVVNAANAERAYRHLARLASLFDAVVTDESSRWALLALQGPAANDLLAPLTEADLAALKKNRIISTQVAQWPARVARTGYTGEDGFEIFLAPAGAVPVWQALSEAKAVPCGLGARDTLRLEAGFPLYGHELTDDTNPLCTPYAWVVKDKTFYGREKMWDPTCERRLVGLELSGAGVPREGYTVLAGAEPVGRITSGTVSPLTRKGIAMAWVDAELSQPQTALKVEIRSKMVPASVTKPPFYP